MRNLADGMAIEAQIEARLLGMRLLTLDAEITVLPPARASLPAAGITPEPATTSLPAASVATRSLPRNVAPVSGLRPAARVRLRPERSNGKGALARAARMLASGEAELQAAREHTPGR